MKFPLLNFRYEVPTIGSNSFGARRRYDIHTGVDLFADNGEVVYSIQDGIVVSVGQFTGSAVGSPWWNDTDYVLIASEIGVILYGEISSVLSCGEWVKSGQQIGNVKQVLYKDKGLPMSMLHLELYDHGYCGAGEVWIDSKPQMLLDPTHLLIQLYEENRYE